MDHEPSFLLGSVSTCIWLLVVNELNLNLKVLCSCTAVIYIKCFKLVATKLPDKDDIGVI